MAVKIVDRRRTPDGSPIKGGSIANTQRYLKRAQAEMWQASREALKKYNITDDKLLEEKISVSSKNTKEPFFHHGPGGKREMVHPGNQEYVKGDKIARPQGGGGGGGSQGGEGDPDAVEAKFKRFIDMLFDGCKLPFLRRTSSSNIDAEKHQRAGITRSGIDPRRHIERTAIWAMARRNVLHRPKEEELEAWQKYMADLNAHFLPDSAPGKLQLKPVSPDGSLDHILNTEMLLKQAQERLDAIVRKRASIPYIDPFDQRFKNFDPKPKPQAKVAMFFLLDVSGSMDEEKIEAAKAFFQLWYLFIKREYGPNIDIIPIVHTDKEPKIVPIEALFNSGASGGTKFSPSYEFIDKEIKKRGYTLNTTNVFLIQASDSDNALDDNPKCKLLLDKLLKTCSYMAYLHVGPPVSESGFWKVLGAIEKENFNFVRKACANGIKSVPGIVREILTPKSKDQYVSAMAASAPAP